MDAPPIDRRSYADLVAETEALAQRLSGWRPRPDGQPDPGQALIRIFGRFAELVVQRLNRVPDKNYLAFLDLIGTKMQPPQAARVPLTFRLAANSPVDATVPAGTLVAAAPQEGEQDEVVFETDGSLVVSRSQLRAVYISDTGSDRYSDRTAPATGQVDQPFDVFTGDQPTPHHLYLACDQILAQPGSNPVTVTLASTDRWQWSNWPISWEYWDGTAWQPAASNAVVGADAWQVTLPGLPPVPAREIGGTTAAWLRARLALALPPGVRGRLPESVAVGARNPQNPSFPLSAFGDASSAKRFYLSADDVFGAGGARARLRVTLAQPGTVAAAGLQLNWSYLAGDQWVLLGQSGTGAEQIGASNFDLRDQTLTLTRDGEIGFQVPLAWPRTLYRTRTGRWLRVDIAGTGQYRTLPQIGSLAVEFDWNLPRIGRITVRAGAPPQPDLPVSACLSYNDFGYTDHTAAATGQRPPFTPFVPTADTEPSLYFGLDRPLDNRPVTLYLQVEPPRPEEVSADRMAGAGQATPAQLAWEYSAPGGWRSLAALDETETLSSRGLVRFVGPADLASRSRFGQTLCWLRARHRQGTFALPPRLRRVLLNTVWAAQVATVEGEILGASNGNPGQRFRTAQAPVQPGQRLVVREPDRPAAAEEQQLAAVEGAAAVTVTTDAVGQPDEVWVRWHAVPDFYQSGPRDRHYTVDAVTGEIAFGDGSFGMIPPLGQNNIRITYQTGGGEQGNRAAGTILQLRSGIPYVEAVTNHEPAAGGAPLEPIARLRDRGPRVLRHGDRAVAVQDLEDLATAASTEVARAAVVVPAFNPYNLWLDPQAPTPTPEHAAADAGRIGVVVVPKAAGPELTGAMRPTPSLRLLRQVRAHLAERCPPAADLWVGGPEWIAVAVAATVMATSLEAADTVDDDVRAALVRFLHPLTGGPDGTGFGFGRRPHRSELFALVESVERVDHVRSMAVSFDPDTADPDRKLALQRMLSRPLTEPVDQPELERDLQRWLDRALVYLGTQEITVAAGQA